MPQFSDVCSGVIGKRRPGNGMIYGGGKGRGGGVLDNRRQEYEELDFFYLYRKTPGQRHMNGSFLRLEKRASMKILSFSLSWLLVSVFSRSLCLRRSSK